MRLLREWFGVALAAVVTLYGAYLAYSGVDQPTAPRWEGPYVNLLYLDLFALLGKWLTVAILGFLTILAAGLVLRRRPAGVASNAPAQPQPALPPPVAAPPAERPAAPIVSPDRIARVMGQPSASATATLPVLRKAPSGEMTPAERMLADALAKVQRERGVLVEEPPKASSSLRLVPQVPVRDTEDAAAWFGGGARLLEGRAWPEIDGEALQLILQIACAKLPEDLWGGIGPRQGWLAIFLAPRSFKAQVLHFSEAGPFQPSPAIFEDSNMVHPDLWKSENALRPAAAAAFPRWPVDLVEVQAGQEEPRRPGRSRAIGWQDYLDLADPRHQPFDWPSAQMMMQLACDGFERAVSAPDAALDPEGPVLLEKLRDLRGATDVMAKSVPFSADIVAVLLAETRNMPAFQPRIPQRRDGRKANGPDRGADPAPAFARPAAPNMLEPTAWQVSYVRYLQDRAKHVHSGEPGALPGPLSAHCEDVWREWATHEMGSMGHAPWGKLRSFDPKDEVILLELPSSQLMNWHFGNAANLVLTIRKDDLVLGEFGRVSLQVSG